MSAVAAVRRSSVLSSVGPSAVAASSQALALAQLALLLLSQPAGPTTDAYFLVLTWSLAPIQIALVGVAYPRWLRAQGYGRRAGVAGLAAVALAGAGAAAGAGALLSRVPDPVPVLVAVTALLAANSAVLTLGWALALRAAAQGRGWLLAGVTLPSNLGACLALLVPLDDPGQRVVAMCSGLLVGSALYSTTAWLRETGAGASGDAPRPTQGAASDSGWFAARSVTGYGAGLTLQTVAAAIPAPGLTYVNVLARLVSGFATVVTNALLPRLVTAASTSPRAAIRYCWMVTVAGVAGGVAIALMAQARQDPWLALGGVGAAWVVAATLNAAVQRVADRFAPARLAVLSVVTSAVVVASALAGSGLRDVNLIYVLAAFVGLDLLSGVAYAVVLRETRLAAVACTGVVAVLALAVGPLPI